jgi:hypothetical protein
MWKKGQLQADEDEEKEDPTVVTAIIPSENSIDENSQFGTAFK